VESSRFGQEHRDLTCIADRNPYGEAGKCAWLHGSTTRPVLRLEYPSARSAEPGRQVWILSSLENRKPLDAICAHDQFFTAPVGHIDLGLIVGWPHRATQRRSAANVLENLPTNVCNGRNRGVTAAATGFRVALGLGETLILYIIYTDIIFVGDSGKGYIIHDIQNSRSRR